VAEWVRHPLLVESDCLTLIKALRSSQPNRASWLGIITEIKELSQLFPKWGFIHMQRDGNQVAHTLAQLAMKRKLCKVMRSSIPQEIAKFVKNDLNTRVMSDPEMASSQKKY
jgi:hypothetical protein